MAMLGDKLYNYCVPFADTPQKLLITILILLGLLALLEYSIKLVTVVSRPKHMCACAVFITGMGRAEKKGEGSLI